jgi:hypothetical protein
MATGAPVASAQQMSVETWLRSLASTQKFELVVGVGVGSVLVTPPAVATPASIGDTLAKVGVPFGFTTSKDGSRILILQLGVDALSKSVGIAGGSGGATSSGDPSLTFRESRERDRERGAAESEAEAEKPVEDPNDPRLQPKPILPPQADPDDPIEAMIDRSIPPLPKQIDMSDPDESQVDPLVKPLPPQIDYNDPDERRTPPPPAPAPGASSPPQKSGPKSPAPPKPAPAPGAKTVSGKN